MKACELCGKKSGGLRHTRYTACPLCLDKLLEFAITAEMRFENESTPL